MRTAPQVAPRPLSRHIALGIAVATVASLAACAPTAAPEGEETSITIAVDGLAPQYNPILGGHGISSRILDHDAVLEGLITWNDETDSPDPWLATELELSDDRQTIAITLRDDVDFVDGEHMTAQGVADYYNAVVASDVYTLAGSVADYDVVFTATGEYTLEMTAVKPIYFNGVVSLLFGNTPVLSPAALEDPERAANEPLGTGPYLIDEYVPDVSVSYVRNPDYWNPEAYPYDTVVLQVMVDPVARLNALKSGQIDAAELPTEFAIEGEAAGLSPHEFGGAFATLLIGDPVDSENPALRDVRVRRAMALAFDHQAITEQLYHGYGSANTQPFAPGQPSYIEGADDTFAYDLDEARDLMAEAGYPDGFDVAIPVSPSEASLQPIIQQSLADIGIRVTFEQYPDPATLFLDVMVKGTYPLVMFASLDYVNSMRILDENFGERGVFVPTEEVSELVQTVKTGNAEDSVEAGQELGRFLLEEVWYVPIASIPSFWVSIPDVDTRTSEVVSSYGIMLRDFQVAD